MGDLAQEWTVEAAGGQVTPGEDAAIAVPSGQVVTLQETIWNAPGPMGMVTRFRFLAPAIARNGGTVDFAAASADMAHLCQAFALDRVVQAGAAPAQVIISLADQVVPFGEAAPEATQYFEAYRIEDGACIWEAF
jgi:Family of unknown function (DUF6497)